MTWHPTTPTTAPTSHHPVISDAGQQGFVRVEKSGPPLFRRVALAGFVRDEDGRILDLGPKFRE